MNHVIYGPPGTGKSTNIIARFNELLKTHDSSKIGLVSFTKAAAIELASRLDGQYTKGNVATIHSFCYRITGTTRAQVIGYGHIKEFEKIVGIPISGGNPDDDEDLTDGDYYLTLHGLAKAQMRDYGRVYDESSQPGERSVFIYFAESYDNWKKAYGYVDFADMLSMSLDCPPPDLDFLFVDEAQDLSPLQWSVIRHWSERIGSITIAGDDDQAIYVWGGADPRGMQEFETSFNAERTVLGQSWRIPSRVHELAHHIIGHVSYRVDKKYEPRIEEGRIRHISSPEQVRLEHGQDALVLYRNHVFRKEVEETLIRHGVPYICDSGRPGVLQGPVMNAIRLLKKLRDNLENLGIPALNDREMRVLNKYLSPITLGRLKSGDYDYVMSRGWKDHVRVGGNWLSYLSRIERNYGFDVVPTIHLATIHGSKGREADTVVLINGITNRVAQNMAQNTEKFDSEMRTFYVGVTRTRNELQIVSHDNEIPMLYRGA